MDQTFVDRVARALGVAFSRREGALIALIGAIGAAIPGTLAGRSGRPRAEGPCGDGSRKANACLRDRDCCTGHCDTSVRKRNRDGKGRCRCRKQGAPCQSDRSCCNGRSCIGGTCRRSIQIGRACNPAVHACADPRAACVPYFDDVPAGTYCLLPDGASCSASGQCESSRCVMEACAEPCRPVVCPSCRYATIQEAIDAAADGATIRIADGVYEEALTIARSLTLEACTGATIVRRDRGRTITITAGTVELRHLTIAGDPPATDDAATGVWGGISCDTGLILSGTTRVVDGFAGDSYGGAVFMQLPPSSLLMKDRAAIEGCKARMAGAVYLYSGSMVMQDQARIVNCSTKSSGGFGGAVFQRGGSFTMSDDAVIEGCTASYLGGGAALLDTVGVMNGRSEVRGCTAAIRGGGFSLTSPNNPAGGLTMNDSSAVTGNDGTTAGGGIDAVGAAIVMNGSARVTGNTAGNGGGVFLGVESTASKAASLVMNGAAAVTGNTAGASGGGVLSGDAGCTLVQNSGTIAGNSPDQCAGVGIAC